MHIIQRNIRPPIGKSNPKKNQCLRIPWTSLWQKSYLIDIRSPRDFPFTLKVGVVNQKNRLPPIICDNFHRKLETLECKDCSINLRNRNSLERHLRVIHKGLKEFKCKACSKNFSESGTLKKHLRTVHIGANIRILIWKVKN